MTARVVALGSGDAFCSGGRGHTSWLIDDAPEAPATAGGAVGGAGGLALVDAGATVLSSLWRAGIDPERIDAVHLTHLHGDHIAGWPFLLIDGYFRSKRTRPLLATGPPGTGEGLKKLFEACYADAAERSPPFAIEVQELAPGESATVCGRRVLALRAQHMRAPHVALSLRIEEAFGTLAFTGDTGAHEGLVALSRGASVLFAECTDLHAPAAGAGEPSASSDYPPEAGRRHLSWDELRPLLPRLGVRRVVLGHLSSAVRAARERIVLEARALDVELAVCDDLDSFDLALP
ncbi:MAG TPA: MBL fold metallo-hydrolase [Myxococcales bacterium]|nr:MBL fold metallo-hydrolase [Myxococcales bacterium]